MHAKIYIALRVDEDEYGYINGYINRDTMVFDNSESAMHYINRMKGNDPECPDIFDQWCICTFEVNKK